MGLNDFSSSSSLFHFAVQHSLGEKSVRNPSEGVEPVVAPGQIGQGGQCVRDAQFNFKPVTGTFFVFGMVIISLNTGQDEENELIIIYNP